MVVIGDGLMDWDGPEFDGALCHAFRHRCHSRRVELNDRIRDLADDLLVLIGCRSLRGPVPILLGCWLESVHAQDVGGTPSSALSSASSTSVKTSCSPPSSAARAASSSSSAAAAASAAAVWVGGTRR